MEKKVLIPLAEGFETIEALAVVDVFRRGGVDVDLVSISSSLNVTSSHQVEVTADKLLSDCLDLQYDLIVLPGGIPGAENLKNSEALIRLLENQNKEDKLVGAICASPAVVLEHHGLLKGRNATCHPMFAGDLPSKENVDINVVIDGKCITGKGAGVSVEFGLELLGILMGDEKKQEIAKAMVLA